MPAHYKLKIQLFTVFYASTLTLSICFAAMMAAFAFFASPVAAMRIFALSYMTGGTALSLLYKEMTLKNEYYFYYNKAISKTALIVSCILINIAIGTLMIFLSFYV